MRLAIYNNDIKVVAISERSEEFLHNSLAVRVPGYFWTPMYRKQHWDGYKRFYNKRTRRFPAGLLPLVLKLAKEEKVPFSLVDMRGATPQCQSLWTSQEWSRHLSSRQFRIDPYLSLIQHQAVHAIISSRLEGLPWTRGLISMPTGSGKTVTSYWAALALKTRTLFLVDRKDLFLQGIDVYEALTGKLPGMVGSGYYDPKHVTIGMIQTISRLLKKKDPDIIRFLQQQEAVVVDEAHKVSDNTYLDVLGWMYNTSIRLAFGGSLLRRANLADWNLLGGFGDPIFHTGSRALRDKGLLSQVKVFLFDVNQPKLKCSYRLAEKQVIIRNTYRNELAVQVALKAASQGWVTLLLVSKEEHGKLLQGIFRAYNVEVPFLCYKDPGLLRKHYLNLMRKEEIKVLISSGIFKVGIDVPIIRCLIRLDGGLSEVDSLQIPGRGMRYKEVHNWLYLIDFVDSMNDHFYKHSKKRIGVYKREGYLVEKVHDPENINFENLRNQVHETPTASETSA